jgi:hypothetical protein
MLLRESSVMLIDPEAWVLVVNYATDVDSAIEHHSTGVTAISQCDISIVEWNS